MPTHSSPLAFDAIFVGAGAAGLHGAAIAGQRGLRVLLIDHAEKVGEKIRISGGGRCNFTNLEVGAANFVSANPDFCRSALARYTPRDFIALLERHRIAWHEKHRGQLFCDRTSADVVEMLLHECEAGGVVRWQPCRIDAVREAGTGFELDTDRGTVATGRLVIASGGLSIPKIGATDFGYRIARQFGHRIVETRPALVPLTMDAATWAASWGAFSGVALPATVSTGKGALPCRFEEDLLLTHRGLSGPAALQASTYWRPGTPLQIDCLPGIDLAALLIEAKSGPGRPLAAVLGAMLPRRFAEAWLKAAPELRERSLPDLRDKDLAALARALKGWTLTPDGTEGYRKAEVTAGGVDTRELDSRSLESRRRPGLHFIGEVVDVTGWLGGYNFQWAWASAAACARSLPGAAAPSEV